MITWPDGKGLAFLGFRNTVLTIEKIIIDGLPPLHEGFPSGTVVKNLPANQESQEMWVQSLGQEGPLEEAWKPTAVLLPGKSHGQRSLVGYSPRGHKRVGHDLVTKYQAPPPTPGHCSVSRLKHSPCLPVKKDCLLRDALWGIGFRFATRLKALEAASGNISSEMLSSPTPLA